MRTFRLNASLTVSQSSVQLRMTGRGLEWRGGPPSGRFHFYSFNSNNSYEANPDESIKSEDFNLSGYIVLPKSGYCDEPLPEFISFPCRQIALDLGS
jgi:hypothetical protein